MEDKTPSGQPIVDREKVCQTHHFVRSWNHPHLTGQKKAAPFLIRAFVKTGSFHRLSQFEDVPLPLADELQIFTWYVSFPSFFLLSFLTRGVNRGKKKGKMRRSMSSSQRFVIRHPAPSSTATLSPATPSARSMPTRATADSLRRR